MQNMPDKPEDSCKMLGHALGRILCYLLYAEYKWETGGWVNDKM